MQFIVSSTIITIPAYPITGETYFTTFLNPTSPKIKEAPPTVTIILFLFFPSLSLVVNP